MSFSTRCQYGIRAMLELAKAPPEHVVSVAEISQKRGVPRRFLELVLSDLRRAGLVKSHRGIAGGYTLALEAGDIPVGRIARVFDGSASGAGVPGKGGVSDPLAELWASARQAFDRVLDERTLLDLLQEEQRNQPAGDYTI